MTWPFPPVTCGPTRPGREAPCVRPHHLPVHSCTWNISPRYPFPSPPTFPNPACDSPQTHTTHSCGNHYALALTHPIRRDPSPMFAQRHKEFRGATALALGSDLTPHALWTTGAIPAIRNQEVYQHVVQAQRPLWQAALHNGTANP